MPKNRKEVDSLKNWSIVYEKTWIILRNISLEIVLCR